MKIVLMGSPDFGIPSFQKILDSGYDVPAIVTIPDKQKGRGLKLQFSDVKKFAIENNIEVLQPQDLNDIQFINRLKELTPDLFIIIAFRILPAEIFKIPKLGSINLHASLLPKYRGAAPINHAIINGEKISGLTTFFLDEKIDTGNIIMQYEIPIGINDTFGEVYFKMAEIGADLVLDTIKKISSQNLSLIKQDENYVTKAPKIFKEFCRINWNNDALSIHNLIRGLSPVPSAFTRSGDKLFKILKSSLTNLPSETSPGTMFVDNKKLYASAKDFNIEIITIQPEGKKPMAASEFINGLKKNVIIELL